MSSESTSREFVEYKGSKYEIKKGQLNILNATGVFDANDIKGLENITKLNSLFVRKISEIKNIETLTDLEKLYINDNSITEIKGLEKAGNLKKLYLSNNQISKIKNLDMLKKLEELWIGGNQITKIEGLENLSKLKVLRLRKNRLSEISGLTKLVNLEILDIEKNNIKEIKGLDALINLRELRLNSNKITKIKGLGNLKKLEKLNISYNDITDLEGLGNLINLHELHWDSSKILDYNIAGLFRGLKLDPDGWQSLRISNESLKAQKYVAYCRLKEKLEKPLNEIKSIDPLENALLEKLAGKGDLKARKIYIRELSAKITNGEILSLSKVLDIKYFEILDVEEIKNLLADPDLALTHNLIEGLQTPKHSMERFRAMRVINEVWNYLSGTTTNKIFQWLQQIGFNHLCELIVAHFFDFLDIEKIEELIENPEISFLEELLQSDPFYIKFPVLKVLTDLGVFGMRKIFIEEINKAVKVPNGRWLPFLVDRKYLYFLKEREIESLVGEPNSFFYENMINYIEGIYDKKVEKDEVSFNVRFAPEKLDFLIDLTIGKFNNEKDSEKREKYLKILISLDNDSATLSYINRLQSIVDVDISKLTNLIECRNREKTSIKRLAKSILTIYHLLLKETFSSDPDFIIYHFCATTFWKELKDLYNEILQGIYSTDDDSKFRKIADLFEIYLLLIEHFSEPIENQTASYLFHRGDDDLDYKEAIEEIYEWLTEDSGLYYIEDGFFLLGYTFDGGELKEIIDHKKYEFFLSS